MSSPLSLRLADDRELLYFQDAHTPCSTGSPCPDERRLPPRPPAGDMRFDPLLRRWVAYAPHRQERTHLPPADQCPLCPSRYGRATEIPAADYDVAVFENRFPAFGGGATAAPASAAAPPLGRVHPAVGRCEVIVFGPGHADSLGAMPLERLRTVIGAWAHRTAELSALPGAQHVFVFENRGAEIGVTLHHPHGQIYAYPYVPARIAEHLDAAVEHRARTGGNLFADMLDAEIADGSRIVHAGRHWVLHVPFAARLPLEAHLVPRRHIADLSDLGPAEREELAQVYRGLLRAVDRLYPTPTPYISAWYQSPLRAPGREEYRLHLQLSSPRRSAQKLKHLAGSEAAMGAYIADVLPERIAEGLRGVFRLEPSA